MPEHPTPPTIAAAATSLWPQPRYVLRMSGLVSLYCVGVALLLWAFMDDQLLPQLVHSLCIGLLSWMLIDGGKPLLARLRQKLQAGWQPAYGNWPGWPAMIGLVLLSVPLAWWLGMLLSGVILGRPQVPNWRGYAPQLTGALCISLVTAFLVTWGFYVQGRLTATRAEAEQARRLTAEAELRLLQSQLEPHMLFNTLANLRVLIGLDTERAQAMLDHLIAFLRATLTASRSQSHSLADEFERLSDYVQLMQVRMGARLQVALRLPEELRALSLPPLLLQPLVENAIKHGLEPSVAGGLLTVQAELVELSQGQVLRLRVQDSGVGLGASSCADGTQFGLQQIRERLQSRYGDAASLTLSRPSEGGCLAELLIPLAATR